MRLLMFTGNLFCLIQGLAWLAACLRAMKASRPTTPSHKVTEVNPEPRARKSSSSSLRPMLLSFPFFARAGSCALCRVRAIAAGAAAVEAAEAASVVAWAWASV